MTVFEAIVYLADYIEETRTLYAAIADGCDLGFELVYYNEDGGTQFRFFKRGF